MVSSQLGLNKCLERKPVKLPGSISSLTNANVENLLQMWLWLEYTIIFTYPNC